MINNSSAIDWNELIILVIGAIIGTISSMVTLLIQSIIEKSGRLTMYIKFNCLKNMGKEGWGVYNNPEGGLSLIIPAIFEFENTSKRARVMRDVSLVLLNNKKFVAKMTQINYLHTTTKKNSVISDEEDYYYGDINGSYSFVIDAISIKRENCVYLYKISQSDKERMQFDSIGLQYYDEKNRLKSYYIRAIEGWNVKNNDVDKDWIYIEKKIKTYY